MQEPVFIRLGMTSAFIMLVILSVVGMLVGVVLRLLLIIGLVLTPTSFLRLVAEFLLLYSIFVELDWLDIVLIIVVMIKCALVEQMHIIFYIFVGLRLKVLLLLLEGVVIVGLWLIVFNITVFVAMSVFKLREIVI